MMLPMVAFAVGTPATAAVAAKNGCTYWLVNRFWDKVLPPGTALDTTAESAYFHT